MVSLRSILSEADEREWITHNVALDVKLRRKSRTAEDEKVIPTKDEIRLIIENAPASHHRAIFITAIFTGMRISELRGLIWDCVDLDRRLIKVAKRADEFGAMGAPKSRAGVRDIPLAPIVQQTLSAWRSEALENGLGWVFPNLLHGKETSVWADKGYVSAALEVAFSGPDKFWGVTRKAPKGGALHPIDEDINRIIAKVRARVEHPFRVLKRRCHSAIIARGGTAIIPIRRNCQPWKEDCPTAPARNETLRATRHCRQTFWKRWTGYHARSRAKANMRCLKSIDERISARDPDRQTAEIHIRVALINFLNALGINETFAKLNL